MSKFLTTLAHLQGALIGLLGSAILFRSWLTSTSADVLWMENFDSRLIYWIVNWGYHILFEVVNPRSFWDANSFHPHLSSLAISESLISIQVFFAPLRWLNLHPMTALYLSLAATCILGCVLTDYFLQRLGHFNNLETKLITYGAHFSLCMVVFLGHYQLFGFQMVPPFFLSLYLYLREYKTFDLILLCGIFAFGVGFSTYLAPIFVAISILLVPPFIVAAIAANGFSATLKRIGVWSIVIVGATGAVLYFALFRYYLALLPQLAPTTLEETTTYSARLISFLFDRAYQSYWYAQPGVYTQWGQWEYAYFPGYLLALSGIAFVGFVVYKSLKAIFLILREKHRANALKCKLAGMVKGLNLPAQAPNPVDIAPGFLAFMGMLFIISLVLSWGPYAKIDFEPTDVKLPLYTLRQFIPGLANVRAPGRFGMLFGLPLSVFTIFFARKFFRRDGRHWLYAALIASMLVFLIGESLPTASVYAFETDPKGVYQQIERYKIDNVLLLELPVARASNLDTLQTITEQLVGSTIHWARLIVGYGSKTTFDLDLLINTDWALQYAEKTGDLGPILKFARNERTRYLLVHLDRYSPEIAQKWQVYASETSDCVLINQDSILFVELSPCSR